MLMTVATLVFFLNTMYVESRRPNKQWINAIFFYLVSATISTAANYKILDLYYNDHISLLSYKYAIPELYRDSAMIWFLGNTAIIMGFNLAKRNSLPKIEWNVFNYSIMDWLFYISIALVFKKAWLPVLPGAINNILTLFPLFGILVLARFSELYKDKKLFNRALMLTVIAAGYAVLFAYLRTNMLLPIMVFFLGIFSASSTIKTLISPKFTIVYTFLFIFTIFFQIFGANRKELSTGFERINRLQTIRDASEQEVSERESSLSAFERTSSISQISSVAGLVRDNGLYKGRVISFLGIALIPRVFWPEKPKIALGVWFALEIGEALETGDWFNTSINMTIPGQFYLDFGWPGLILGCFLVGLLLRIFWNSTLFVERPHNLAGSLFAVYLLYNAFLGIGADLQIMVTFTAVYLIILTLNNFFKSRNENTLRRANVAGQ